MLKALLRGCFLSIGQTGLTLEPNKGFTYNTYLSLKYQGSVGVFNKFWKDYLKWILNDRKYVRVEKQLSFTDLQNFDFTKKYRINEMNYLVDEIQVTLTSDQIKLAMLKCYTAF